MVGQALGEDLQLGASLSHQSATVLPAHNKAPPAAMPAKDPWSAAVSASKSPGHRPSHHAAPEAVDSTASPQVVRLLCLVFAGITTTVTVIAYFLLPEEWFRWAAFAFAMDAICIAVFVLASRGKPRAAVWILVVPTWALLAIAAFSAGGVDALAISAELAVVVLAGLLLGWEKGVYAAVATVALIVGLAFLQLRVVIPSTAVIHTTWSRALILVALVVVIGVLPLGRSDSSCTRPGSSWLPRSTSRQTRCLTWMRLG